MLEFGKMTTEDHKEALRYLQDYKHLLEDKKFFAYRHHTGNNITGFIHEGLKEKDGFLYVDGLDDTSVEVCRNVDETLKRWGYDSIDEVRDGFDKETIEFIKKNGLTYIVSYEETFKITTDKDEIESILLDILNDGQSSINFTYNEAVEELEECIKNGTKNELLVKYVLEYLRYK